LGCNNFRHILDVSINERLKMRIALSLPVSHTRINADLITLKL